MKITLITVGKIKEKFYRDAVGEFENRLSKYCDLNIVEVADEKTSESLSEREEELIKEKEGKRILNHSKDNTYLITLEIDGKNLTSEEHAKKIQQLQVTGKSNITYVIGGSLGLSKIVTDKSDFALSFSKMTFPHQLMRVIFLEQLYRGFRIINNEPYHK